MSAATFPRRFQAAVVFGLCGLLAPLWFSFTAPIQSAAAQSVETRDVETRGVQAQADQTRATRPQRARRTADDPFRVFMITFRGCEEACQGFIYYFEGRNLPVAIVHRDVERDASRVRGYVAEAKAMEVDMLVTWGTSTALEALGTYDDIDPERHMTDVPAVFMIVSSPLDAKIVPSLSGSGRNITGTLYLVTEETQVRAARNYMDFDTLAVIYNPQEANSVNSVEVLRGLAEREDFTLLERPVPLDDEGRPDPETIPGLVAEVADLGADLLYQGPDTFLNVNRDALTGAALEHRLPVFAAGEAPVVTSNALMGVINRYYTVGQFTAGRAERILFEGADPATMPIEAPRRFSYLVNMRVARALELYPPMNLLRIAEIVE